MSLLRSIRQQLGLMSGGNESQNHFWDGSVANQLTLKRGVPDAPGAEIIKVLNGALSFPNQGQSLTANGYVKLPGGLIVQWGIDNQTTGYRVVTLPIPFPTGMLCGVATMDATGHTPTGSLSTTLLLIDAASFGLAPRYANSGGQVGEANQPCRWIAIGY